MPLQPSAYPSMSIRNGGWSEPWAAMSAPARRTGLADRAIAGSGERVVLRVPGIGIEIAERNGVLRRGRRTIIVLIPLPVDVFSDPGAALDGHTPSPAERRADLGQPITALIGGEVLGIIT